jgi:cytochrome c
MKKILTIALIASTIILSSMLSGCYVSKKTADKSGAELWAENCNRCHNAPGPGEFNNDNWDIVGTHMQIRANLSKTEVEKVTAFLKSLNN